MKRLAHWLAVRRVPKADREFVLGDLDEEFRQRAHDLGGAPARLWLWRTALRAVVRTHEFNRHDHVPARNQRERMADALRSWWLALRGLSAKPAMAAVAVITLALGLGANVAIFTVAWPVLAGRLPFPDEDRLTVVSLTYTRSGPRATNPVSIGDFNDLRKATSFSSMVAFSKYTSQMNLTAGSDAEQLVVGSVTEQFFDTLGVRPLVGRLLQSSDQDPSARLVVLAERAWRRRFGADPAIVGRTLQLDGGAYQVIGVAPAAAGLGTIDPEAWTRHQIDPTYRQRGAYFLGLIGRLAPGATLAAANGELAAIAARAAVEFPQFNTHFSANAVPIREATSAPLKDTMQMLVASAGLVLVVAMINLAGLQVTRHMERGRELAVRRAIGASAWQLAVFVLREQTALAMVGGLGGLVVALGTLEMLESVAPAFGWRHLAPASRIVVGSFAIGLSGLAALVVGAWPAWRAATVDASSALQARVQTASRRTSRLRMVVLVTQVAATSVLLVGAALLARSQARALAVDTGFDLRGAIAADLSLPQAKYPNTSSLTSFFERLQARVLQSPAISGVCFMNDVPLDRGPGSMTYVAEGTTRLFSSLHTVITPGCEEVLRVPIVSGRWFIHGEPTTAVVLSESMARSLWPNVPDPVGRRVHFGLPTGELMTVVGVARDIRAGALEGTVSRVVWMPTSNGYYMPRRMVVKPGVGQSVDPAMLKAAVKDVDPAVALANPRSIDDIVSRATAPRRFSLFLLGSFAVVAIVLSGVGIYGLLAHVVGHRRQEIGIRVALGARPSTITGLVLAQLGAAVVVGVGLGLYGARTLSRALEAQLFNVERTDALTYGAAAVFVVVLAGLAAWVPLRRALRIDPALALRGE